MTKLTKKMLNPNISLREGNFKLEEDENVVFLIFNLPSKKTCPYATQYCKGDGCGNNGKCFAQYPEYLWETTRISRARNFEESKKTTFVRDMINHLEWQLQRAKFQGRKLYIRIHESGDFWSKFYFESWSAIAEHFQDNDRISFQAYTKSLPYLENVDLGKVNIKLLYSVMPDTKPENIEMAKAMGLTLFELIPLGESRSDAMICGGDCHKCMVCYIKNDVKKIYVELHGPNVKSHKAQDTGKVHQFEKINKYRKNKNKNAEV